MQGISIIYLCDLPVAAFIAEKRRAACYRNLFGLSTPEVYPIATLLLQLVSSYLTFSLSPKNDLNRSQATWFSVALSVTKHFCLCTHPYQVAGCPVLPGLSSPPQAGKR